MIKSNEPLTFRMYCDIRFNRPINRKKDYISPGGYEMVMNDKRIQFDFEESESSIDEKDPCLLHVMQKNPDYDTFKDLKKIKKADLGKVTEIPEFFVYTGEPGESDLEAVKVEAIAFVLPYNSWKQIPVSRKVTKNAVVCGNY